MVVIHTALAWTHVNGGCLCVQGECLLQGKALWRKGRCWVATEDPTTTWRLMPPPPPICWPPLKSRYSGTLPSACFWVAIPCKSLSVHLEDRDNHLDSFCELTFLLLFIVYRETSALKLEFAFILQISWTLLIKCLQNHVLLALMTITSVNLHCWICFTRAPKTAALIWLCSVSISVNGQVSCFLSAPFGQNQDIGKYCYAEQ